MFSNVLVLSLISHFLLFILDIVAVMFLKMQGWSHYSRAQHPLASYAFQTKSGLFPVRPEGFGIGSLPTCLVFAFVTSSSFLFLSTELPSTLSSLGLLRFWMSSLPETLLFPASLLQQLLCVFQDLAQGHLHYHSDSLVPLVFLETSCSFSVQPKRYVNGTHLALKTHCLILEVYLVFDSF